MTASLEDYKVVWELVADLMSGRLDVTVSPTLRETVDVVRRLMIETRKPRLTIELLQED